MKHVSAVFRPARLYDVVTGLRAIPLMPLFTMADVRGFPGPDRDRGTSRRGSREIDSIEMVEIECIIPETLLPRVVDALEAAARTEDPDDFRISVSEAEKIVASRAVHE